MANCYRNKSEAHNLIAHGHDANDLSSNHFHEASKVNIHPKPVTNIHTD